MEELLLVRREMEVMDGAAKRRYSTRVTQAGSRFRKASLINPSIQRTGVEAGAHHHKNCSHSFLSLLKTLRHSSDWTKNSNKSTKRIRTKASSRILKNFRMYSNKAISPTTVTKEGISQVVTYLRSSSSLTRMTARSTITLTCTQRTWIAFTESPKTEWFHSERTMAMR